MSSPFPTPYTVGHRELTSDGDDGHGNTVARHADPVTRRVIGFGPPKTSEPKIVGQDREVVELELAIPPDFGSCKDGDIEIVNGLEYVVVGAPETAVGNPFRWVPGAVVNLKRVEG